MVKLKSTRVGRSRDRGASSRTGERFSRVFAVVVALEHYRKPTSGAPLPTVAYAHADADAFVEVVKEIYKDMPSKDLEIEVMKDGDASLVAIREHLAYTAKNLDRDDLFIFYYAGHGFHGAGGNRLSAFDTNRTNVEGTSVSMRDDLLEPLSKSKCRQAIVFVDACAEKFREVVESRDVISNLDADEVEEFLDSGWYLGVFLSCSPGEKSYPSAKLGHGIWTHFLLEAMSGRATEALTDDRWLVDYGLRDFLRVEVPRFITRETQLRASQTPQAVLSGTNTFQIRFVPQPPSVPPDYALVGIKLRNNGEYLEGSETGGIRQLEGFKRGYHKVPKDINVSADSWCRRLLNGRVAEEVQELYQRALQILKARRKDIRKEQEDGAADLDAPAFRYSIETGQNPDDASEYIIRRKLELRQGWSTHRAAIDELFGNQFDRLVIEFVSMDETFDSLVDKLEDIRDSHGGDVDDNDRTKRARYARDGVSFTFDLAKRRLEISFGSPGTVELVEAAQRFQLGFEKSSPMFTAPIDSSLPQTVPSVASVSTKKRRRS